MMTLINSSRGLSGSFQVLACVFSLNIFYLTPGYCFNDSAVAQNPPDSSNLVIRTLLDLELNSSLQNPTVRTLVFEIPRSQPVARKVSPGLQKFLKEKARLCASKTKLSAVAEMLTKAHKNQFTIEIEDTCRETEVSIDSVGLYEDLLDELLAPVDLEWKAVGAKIMIQPKKESN